MLRFMVRVTLALGLVLSLLPSPLIEIHPEGAESQEQRLSDTIVFMETYIHVREYERN